MISEQNPKQTFEIQMQNCAFFFGRALSFGVHEEPCENSQDHATHKKSPFLSSGA